MRKAILFALVASATILPGAAVAQDHDHDHHDHRLYDKRHKDYHEWSDHEDRAWHMYWEQRHRPVKDWERSSDRDRQRYWQWRHDHSDSLLKIEIH